LGGNGPGRNPEQLWGCRTSFGFDRPGTSRSRERGRLLKAFLPPALGNAHRIAQDFEGARRAFNEAWRILESGTGDPTEEARLISLEASYMKDIGEFELAESSLEEALQLYQRIQDTSEQGRILLQMGEIIGHIHPDRGIAHLQKALALIDASREPRLDLCAQNALAQFLSQGRGIAEIFERVGEYYRRHWFLPARFEPSE
jgi:tetratricopeptide (TPR) repeat protein